MSALIYVEMSIPSFYNETRLETRFRRCGNGLANGGKWRGCAMNW